MLSPLEERLSLFNQALNICSKFELKFQEKILSPTQIENNEFNKDIIHIFSKKDIEKSIIFNKIKEILDFTDNDKKYLNIKKLVEYKPLSVILSINKLADIKLKLKRLDKDI